MYLKFVEIHGFRGINSLFLKLRPNMVLIGENTWGKSSLLGALSTIFSSSDELYQFTESDFHVEFGSQPKKHPQIRLRFTFCEERENEHREAELKPCRGLFVNDDKGLHSLHLEVFGERNNGEVTTHYRFTNERHRVISCENEQEVIRYLIQRHPVYRLRDARLNKSINQVQLTPRPINASDQAFVQELEALALLMKYYFLTAQSRKKALEAMQDNAFLWEKAKELCIRLQKAPHLTEKVREYLSAFFVRDKKLANIGTPIILFEDLDTQLHPRMIAILWALISQLQIQRITTTNSMELLSHIPLKEICRLVRYPDHTQAYQIESSMLGKEDLRKLTFHIHHNRGLALFAKTWILVEGETEVWILEEMAKLLNIDLDIEGVRIVEFAQCGLRPLIKYAKAMGIEWYVLTDGDDAGLRYADTVQSLEDNFASRLTILPYRDIEHFFYHSGFKAVFLKLARWQPNGKFYPTSQIIKRAVHFTSKPDLAIALSKEMKLRGEDKIPVLFKQLFENVLLLTQKV